MKENLIQNPTLLSTDRVMSIMASKYGWSANSAQVIPSFYLNEAAYCVDAGHRRIFFKPYRGSRRQLRRMVRHIQRLIEFNYRHIPQWIYTLDGNPILWHGDSAFYATEWIDGRILGTDADDFYSLGKALAQLHNHRSRKPQDYSLPRLTAERFWKRHNQFRLHLVQIANSMVGTDTVDTAQAWLLTHAAESEEMTQLAKQTLESSGVRDLLCKVKYAPAVIHGDVTRPNILIEKHRVVLLDWEQVKWGNPYEELARALANTANFNINLLMALLSGYECVRPLSSLERQTVAAYFSIPREVWLTAHDLFSGKSPLTWPGLRETWEPRKKAVIYLNEQAALPRS